MFYPRAYGVIMQQNAESLPYKHFTKGVCVVDVYRLFVPLHHSKWLTGHSCGESPNLAQSTRRYENQPYFQVSQGPANELIREDMI
jgi:hypothetical protein